MGCHVPSSTTCRSGVLNDTKRNTSPSSVSRSRCRVTKLMLLSLGEEDGIDPYFCHASPASVKTTTSDRHHWNCTCSNVITMAASKHRSMPPAKGATVTGDHCLTEPPAR